PLAGAVLIFWTAYYIQGHAADRVRELEQSRTHLVDDAAARLRRIERDLHDGPQAQMVAVAMKLGLAREKLTGAAAAGSASTELARALELVEAAHRGAKEAIEELRELARGIHPSVLDHGLGTALSTLAARSGVPVELVTDLPERSSAAIETIAYFCAAELITNVAKHGGARRATLEVVNAAGRLRVRVSDDGCGGARVEASGGLAGLAGRGRTGGRGPEPPTPPPGRAVRPVPVPARAEKKPPPMRIVIAEDSAVVRAGLAEILADRGHEVVAAVGNAGDLLAAVREHHPGVRVVDVRIPPGFTDEGLRPAITIRREHPRTGVLVFSQYIETRYTADLLGAASGGV